MHKYLQSDGREECNIFHIAPCKNQRKLFKKKKKKWKLLKQNRLKVFLKTRFWVNKDISNSKDIIKMYLITKCEWQKISNTKLSIKSNFSFIVKFFPVFNWQHNIRMFWHEEKYDSCSSSSKCRQLLFNFEDLRCGTSKREILF